MVNFLRQTTRPLRAFTRAAVFFLKVFPMIPSKPVDWVTPTPVIEKVRYPTYTGYAEGEVYRPPGDGPFPGIIVCLGVVPFEVDHPQVPVLGRALARAGLAALLYWSPAMRDMRLDSDDLESLPRAYNWLVEQPYVDPARSGMLGTCVGGSFALMACAHPLVRDKVAFASAYAPFSSMRTFARDIASASVGDPERRPWRVDQLTLKVFLHSLAAWLEPGEREWFLGAFDVNGGRLAQKMPLPESGLSADGQLLYALVTAPDAAAAEAALHRLSPEMQARLTALSPLEYLKEIHAPLIVMFHDRGDQLIPIGESRRMLPAFDGRTEVQYTEMNFSHLDPVKGRLPLPHLLRELVKFLRAMYPIFRASTR